MKELSIKEKAKAYEEALERAKKWYNAPNIDKMPTYGNRIIEEIFPELIEENEDEKIRKELIKFVKVNIPNEERYIAWLEKQKVLTPEEDLQGKEDVLWCIKQAKKYAKDENEMGTCWFAEKWLEKQNSNVDNANKEYWRGYREGKQEILDKYAELEKQGEQNLIMAKSPQLGEQKSANNNELKFKVGDWVVENGVNGNPVQITSFEEDKGVGIKVWFSNGTGTWVDYLKGYHKWTIEDARDGDVLADNLGVILFKSIRDNNVINYYAYLSGIFSVQKDEEYWGYAVNCALSPATKEQRKRFFAAMHDAGYEWDAEKKELKKIEQKPDEWSKEDNIRLQRIIDFLWYNRKGDTDDIYQQEQDINWLKSFKDRVQPQSKQEWSVEDKSKVQRICKYLDEAKKYYADITEVRECMDWLKSLKQKIVTK